jgi:uncharacterized protein (TIGR03083 family)
VPQDRTAQRDQLADAHRDAFDGLLTATADLDQDGWTTATGCPGWDVHDQLAHCVGIERRMLGDPDRVPEVEVPDLPHLTSDAGRWIERDVEARRGMSGEELRAEATETFDRRATGLRELDPSALEAEIDGPFGRARQSGMLRTRLFDLTSHERDVRAALGRLDGWSGRHLPIVTEQVLRVWTRVLPARAEGAGTLEIVVDGEVRAQLDLGAGTLERGADAAAPADARLELGLAELLALAGGRDDAPRLESLAWSGDEHLLRRVLAVAGVTP